MLGVPSPASSSSSPAPCRIWGCRSRAWELKREGVLGIPEAGPGERQFRGDTPTGTLSDAAEKGMRPLCSLKRVLLPPGVSERATKPKACARGLRGLSEELQG